MSKFVDDAPQELTVTAPAVRFPDVEVELSGQDGNAFFIIGRVRTALRGHASPAELEEFTNEAMSGDYDHLLQTVMAWVSVS